MKEAVIVAATRTPIGRAFKGSLVECRPDDLTALIVKSLLEKTPGLEASAIEDLIVGCAQPAGESGYNIARAISVVAGLPDVPGTTVNRYCASSLQAVRMAAHAIKAGEGDVFMACGVETVSRFKTGKADGMPDTKNPIFADAMARSAEVAEKGADAWAPAEGLPDFYIPMGQTAENVALLENVTREDMDIFAAGSQTKAVDAWEKGVFDSEITPVTLADGTVVKKDDCPRPGTVVEKLAGLKPVFRPDGRVTAGNACPLNDGAAGVVVMSAERAKELGLQPLARIVSTGVSALNPEIMGMGPVAASEQAMKRAGMSISDVDLVEINEAFAAQVIPSARKLNIDDAKLNVSGGAIALGHPFGMTGARILTTLLTNLKAHDKTIGLETMCVGGGQGMAMIVERLS